MSENFLKLSLILIFDLKEQKFVVANQENFTSHVQIMGRFGGQKI